MDHRWLAGLKTEKDREEIKEILKNSTFALDKLSKICYNIRIEKIKTKSSDFDDPNWALKRAYLDGQISQLDELISLLSIKDRKEG